MWYKSSGIVKYFTNPYKVIIEIEADIVGLYYSLVPKARYLKRQFHAPHISVVRNPNVEDMKMENWGLLQGETVEFLYESIIQNCAKYHWINVLCPPAEEIRRSLGLEIYKRDEVPEGYGQLFHISIGNCKY